MNETLQRVRSNLESVIRGKSDRIDLILTAFVAGGNVLLNDVPGVGKTSLAKAIAASIHGTFHRIQFTPDLLPADILGGSIYNPREGTFLFRKGPIFAHVLLADEINRASPRTQSSLLEAMAEGQASIEGETYPLPFPFWVIATQNPVEYHGTYPLPEAQLDRFMIEMTMGYPPQEQERHILSMRDQTDPMLALKAVCSPGDILALQETVRHTHVDEDVERYLIDLITATRKHPSVQLGASPRGSIALYRMAQAHARMQGMDHVLPDHIKDMAVPVLAHRLVLETKARYAGMDRVAIVRDILKQVRVPV